MGEVIGWIWLDMHTDTVVRVYPLFYFHLWITQWTIAKKGPVLCCYSAATIVPIVPASVLSSVLFNKTSKRHGSNAMSVWQPILNRDEMMTKYSGASNVDTYRSYKKLNVYRNNSNKQWKPWSYLAKLMSTWWI